MDLKNFSLNDLWYTENSWSKVTKALWLSIWIYVLCGILSTFCGWIDSLQNVGDLLSSDFDLTPSTAGVFEIILDLLVIAGYVIFYHSISNFVGVQKDDIDAKHVGDIKTAYILILIGAGCGLIPVIGWIAALVLNIIAYVKLLTAYKALSTSPTWTDSAHQGAAKLRVATILELVAVCVAWIPIVGLIAVMVLQIVAFFMLVKGWELIHAGAPVEQPAPQPAPQPEEPVAEA